jgi:hypothetical protein
MASGAFLPAVRFDAALRKELAKHLRGYDSAAIIPDLERVVEVLPAFRRAPRHQSVRRTLDELRTAAARLQRLLRQIDEDAEEHLHNALALLRHQEPATFQSRLIEALDGLDDAIDEALDMIQPGQEAADPGTSRRPG